ncbi:DUF418 domain-containing protein [Staphylococcus equorum]|uniref:DUF418 domain-containing protein n=1 Tax=Staphylococcus equorum TaxID=246432 RepID=UPI0007048217|nr:DUF418 domain-containing protein [Staphylococcus equorum]ALM56404.1 hypothetical protein SE1039_06210 [Staphylococcus equorum]
MNESVKYNRISELDYMRGFALLGIILTNIISIFVLPAPSNYDQVSYLKFIDFFVESKFFTIFTFLFGVGFYIFIRNAKAKQLNSNIVFIRRLVILACFGILHQMLQPGEALLLYSIIGLILLAICLYIGNKTILPIPYFILGLAAGQFNIFENIKTKVLIVIVSASGVMSALSWILLNKSYVFPTYKFLEDSSNNELINKYIQNKDLYDQLIVVTSPFIALFYVSLLLLIIKVRSFAKILSPLRLYGRMALTNYVGQTLLIWLVILCVDSDQVDYMDTLWICIAIYILQLLFTSIWLKYFKYGPLEYIWRMGTYWKWFSLIKK